MFSVAVRPAGRVEALPEVLDDLDGRPRNRRVALDEVTREREAEVLDRVEGALGRERVDGVLHRVRGQDRGVVALDVRILEVPLETHRDGEVLQVVPVRPPRHLDQADARLAVGVGAEHDSVSSRLRFGQVPRYVE